MGSGFMYFCGRMTPRGMAIAINMASKEVTTRARMRSLYLALRLHGDWDLSGRDVVDWIVDWDSPVRL